MPSKTTLKRARQAARTGKRPSTHAGEFVREEIEHIRHGKHGARSTKQAIAIGLQKARRAGMKLPAPAKGTTTEQTRKSAENALEEGRAHKKPSPRRSRAVREALKHEGHSAASPKALSRQASSAARRRSAASRSEAAKKAAKTRKRRA